MIENYCDIQEQFNKAISYSQHINLEDLQTDQLFSQWATNKEKFYKAFGNKLIYELSEPVSFALSENFKDKTFDNFLDFIFKYDTSPSLNHFLIDNKEAFFDNKVAFIKEEYPKEINIGMKISKAFKFFVSKRDLKYIQEEYSRILQVKSITGTLCLSIHPLDYITVSENNDNWRSCHALNGEYRAGNLNYMADKTTVIAYLKHKEDSVLERLGSLEWNSKKWRCLLFFSEHNNMIAMGKHYPFFLPNIIPFLDMVLEKAKIDETRSFIYNGYWQRAIDHIQTEVISEKGEVEEKNFPLDKRYIKNTYTGLLKTLNKFILENEHRCYYNDLLYSSDYLPFIKKNDYALLRNKELPIQIGEDVYCLSCGERVLHYEDSMICEHCAVTKTDLEAGGVSICPICGSRFITDEGCWTTKYNNNWEDFVCPTCLNA